MKSVLHWITLLLLGAMVLTSATTVVTKKKSRTTSVVPDDTSFFDKWNTFKEMEGFMQGLAKKHKKSKMVKLSVIGKSAEHRSLTLMTLGSSTPKYQLMLMGTMHGREWITSHSILYLAHQLLTAFEQSDPRVVELFQDTQIHLLPLLNPDGYEYTRQPAEKSEQAREWRKNRRNLCSKCERGVHGIDLNRNWGIKDKSWGFGADRATSEVYQGKRPFSEPEIKAVRDWLLKNKRGQAINGFFDVHCCSGAVLPPFYYNGEPEDLQERNLANCGAISKAMKQVNNHRYKFRPREKEFSDSNTGIGADWIFAEAKVQNVFIVETRGNRTKLLKYIFEVPEKEIIPISKELEAGFWKMVDLFASASPISEQISIADADPAGSADGDEDSESSDTMENDDAGATSTDAVARPVESAPSPPENSKVGNTQQRDVHTKEVQTPSELDRKKGFRDMKPKEMSLDDLLSNFADDFNSGESDETHVLPSFSDDEISSEVNSRKINFEGFMGGNDEAKKPPSKPGSDVVSKGEDEMDESFTLDTSTEEAESLNPRKGSHLTEQLDSLTKSLEETLDLAEDEDEEAEKQLRMIEESKQVSDNENEEEEFETVEDDDIDSEETGRKESGLNLDAVSESSDNEDTERSTASDISVDEPDEPEEDNDGENFATERTLDFENNDAEWEANLEKEDSFIMKGVEAALADLEKESSKRSSRNKNDEWNDIARSSEVRKVETESPVFEEFDDEQLDAVASQMLGNDEVDSLKTESSAISASIARVEEEEEDEKGEALMQKYHKILHEAPRRTRVRKVDTITIKYRSARVQVVSFILLLCVIAGYLLVRRRRHLDRQTKQK